MGHDYRQVIKTTQQKNKKHYEYFADFKHDDYVDQARKTPAAAPLRPRTTPFPEEIPYKG